MKPLGSHSSFLELMADFNVQVPPASFPKWRLLFPNVGTLDGFPNLGSVMICATDGLEALYHIDESGTLWRGHLLMFRGPVSKVYVFEEDWDYEKNKRKVRVFRRHDGSFAIIPQDTFMESYWSVHPRMSKDEKELYERYGMEAGRGTLNFADIDESLRALRERGSQVSAQRKNSGPTKRQQLLATL